MRRSTLVLLFAAIAATAIWAQTPSKAIGPKPDDPRQAKDPKAIGPKPDDPRQAKNPKAIGPKPDDPRQSKDPKAIGPKPDDPKVSTPKPSQTAPAKR